MNKTNIEWCDYTLNPVVGCQTGCKYCYAEKLNQRFGFVKNWNEPEFFPERLDDPAKLKKPARIFVGSMCDLMGDWIPDEWIQDVAHMAWNNLNHQFMFLTKFPNRYRYFTWSENCWLGATVESYKAEDRIYDLLDIKTQAKKFVSIEPIMGGFGDILFDGIDLIIVGAMTGKNPVIPKINWVKSIEHPNILYKKNILKYFPDLKTN